MYTVLIVEDEPLELQALTKLVGMYTAQVREIFQARDSKEALALAREHTPDILLMDINIPGQTGLEVVEILREEGYNGAIVIITAYSHFEYAKTALRANVENYLLKPIDSTELDDCLQSVFSRLELANRERMRISRLQDRIQMMSNYIQPFVLDLLMNAAPVENTMRTLFDWPEDGKLQAFVLRFTFASELDEDEQKCFVFDFCALCQTYFGVIASADSHQVLLVLQTRRAIDPAQAELMLWCYVVRMQQFIQNRDRRCALQSSCMYTHYAQFSEFPTDPNRCFPTEPPLHLHAIQKYIRSSAGVQQAKAAMRFKSGAPDKAFSVFRTMINDPSAQWAGIYLLFNALLESIPNIDLSDAINALLADGRPTATAVNEWINQNASRSENTPAGTSSGFIIQSALEIIKDEFNNPLLSQAEIAEHLGLSQAYFSRLFKKETGETFITYLTRTRLDYAKVLLLEHRNISEVVDSCGYQSKKYFLDTFRQNFGISVSQFMEEIESQ